MSTVGNRIFDISNITITDRTSKAATIGENDSITVPKSWSVRKFNEEEGQSVVFSRIVKMRRNGIQIPVLEKSIMINTDKILHYYAYGCPVDPEGCQLPRVLTDITSLPTTLERFKNMNVCVGLGAINIYHLSGIGEFKDNVERWHDNNCTMFKDNVGRWHDNNCTMIWERKRCDSCATRRKRLLQRQTKWKNNETLQRLPSNPIERKKLITLQKKYIRERRGREKIQQRVQLLMQSLKKADETCSTYVDMVENCCKQYIPTAQHTVLRAIIAAGLKPNTKGRRYSDDWMILCILMNICSPDVYEFLRNNNVVPLPCCTTLHNYFLLIEMNYFNKQFEPLLREYLKDKSPAQRHYVLLLAEVDLKKSSAVRPTNSSHVDSMDLSNEEAHCTDIHYGLVMMLQPITDSDIKHPTAIFASKVPVNGEEVAKLLIKSIIYLEKRGAKIHGVVTDGAATNAKIWPLFDISGALSKTKTSFKHPLFESRKVFVFSDTSNIVKNIRNRLYNKNKLRMTSSVKYICWDYFKTLFDVDSKCLENARYCPELTQKHVVLDDASKMHVRFATQIFSESVKHGLLSYLTLGVESFVGCEETIKFCTQMNDMYYTLNRKSPNDGLTLKSKGFKMLQYSLDWLNKWESAKEKGDITADEYLDTETSEALRISLLSMIVFCDYLVDKYKFKFLLTGKVNQEKLEEMKHIYCLPSEGESDTCPQDVGHLNHDHNYATSETLDCKIRYVAGCLF